MDYKKWVLAVICICLGGFMDKVNSKASADVIYRYLITETTIANSFDPLEADNTYNLPVARMIYATPLEISNENQLSSNILSSFKYDQNTKTIEWLVKSNLKFDDGTPLTVDDVIFSIARMAYTRPQFPVIEYIEGLEKWVKEKQALKSLPSGIKIYGNKILINLTKHIEHPLFRFCLEIFSIIPKRCVDLNTNKILCNQIPSSGYYKIIDKTKDSILFLKRNEEKINNLNAPIKIRFDYVRPEDLSKNSSHIDDKTVIAGNEVMFSNKEMQNFENNFMTKFTPSSRFFVLLLNPNIDPFKDKKCRQYFAKVFRQTYSDLASTTQPLEASIFTKILPGYLSLKDLAPNDEILFEKSQAKCKLMFSKSIINWGYPEGEANSTFNRVFLKTLDKIGVKISEPIKTKTRQDLADHFSDGKIAVYNGGSGFWALDPSGDIKMLFTPNLHKSLKFVSEDGKLQKMISDLSLDQSNFVKINKYLYEEAKFNVYTHLRRFYTSTNKELLSEIPFAITSPAPWQVFKVN